MTVELFCGDNLDVMPTLEANSIDTVITDPPYGLEFMGKEWDHGVPGVAYWKECLRVAKPGAALCAFGGTRTHHRLMCAIEDAGWEIRDVLMWVYGSGFPKSHDISKAIDKAAGAEREVVGPGHRHNGRAFGSGQGDADYGTFAGGVPSITAPATPAAALWDGWGTALKPAYEPIIVAMKPREGTFANNALEWGVAGINVDGCRVQLMDGDSDMLKAKAHKDGHGHKLGGYDGGWKRQQDTVPSGRWPANLVLSHTLECRQVGVRKVKSHNPDNKVVEGEDTTPNAYGDYKARALTYHADPDGTETVPAWECAPGCPVAMLDAQSGEGQAGAYPAKRNKPQAVNCYGEYSGINLTGERIEYDTGGASRFFECFSGSGAVVGTQGKQARSPEPDHNSGNRVQIPTAPRFFYCAKASRRERTCGGTIENGHPTIKPLELMRWLCRLTSTPTGGVVLDPFMGSGTTGMAAILEGREFIGIELERESFEIAQARVAWAREQVPEMVQAEMAL